MNFFSDLGKFILRISFSLMMLTHGISKVDRLFADEIKFSDPIGLGSFLSLILIAFAEFVAPIFILIGFKTRWFSIFPVIGILLFLTIHQHLEKKHLQEQLRHIPLEFVLLDAREYSLLLRKIRIYFRCSFP